MKPASAFARACLLAACAAAAQFVGVGVGVGIGVAAAETDSVLAMGDYAHGIPVTAAGTGNSIYELELPAAVYRASRQAGLRDLAMFNASGEPVPFGVTQRITNPNQSRIQIIAAFALDVPVSGNGQDVQIALRRNASGRIEFAESMAVGTPTERQYILDASRLQRPFSAITLKWQRPSQNFVQRIGLDASDDLSHWSPLSAATTIAYLRQARGKVLRHNQVRFATTSKKYLRVRFLEAAQTGDAPRLVSASLQPVSAQTAVAPRRMALTPTRVDKHPGRFQFSVPHGLVVTRIKFAIDRPDTYMKMKLWNRATERDKWAAGGQATVYNLSAGGETIRDSGIAVSGGPRRHWSFAPARSGVDFGGSPPLVQIDWQPHLAVFVAQGEGPFTLAYGSARTSRKPVDARQILGQLHLKTTMVNGSFGLPVAVLGQPADLSGEAAYHVPFWVGKGRQWGLWAVLVLAVCILLWMAVKLLKEPEVVDPKAGGGQTP